MAVVTNPLIAALRTGYSKIFQDALTSAPSHWNRVATLVPSTNASNTFGWLGQFPGLQEWAGSRVLKSIKEHGYTLTNKKFESTVGIPRTAVEDDQLGVYAPLFAEMGNAAATHPDTLVFGLLKSGHTELCYDGKPFFAADHPVFTNVDGTGTASSLSNLMAPASDPGPAWYLLDVSRPLKPLIFQERTKPELDVITTTTNDTVFMTDEIPYGVRYRCNAGFGFWQLAVKSTETLDSTGLNKAITALQTMKADGGRLMGVGFGGEAGTLLLVPPTLRAAGKAAVEAEFDAYGASNTNYKAATLLVSPWLV